jgi:hypothetical protein
MKTMHVWTGLCALILLASFAASEASGIPAFARKYDMSCLTCHQPAPKLKAYGEEFAGNGFQLPGKEPPRAFRNTGDDWLLLMRELPLALRLEGFVRWLPNNDGRTEFETPYLLKILSGGQIARDVSYYFYFFFDERGEVAGLEDAFIMFNDVFSTPLDVYAGQFQISDPLFKRELRLTFEDYQIYRLRPGPSRINLTYDRGFMFTYGFPSGTDLTFEIVNGSGIGPADASRLFDIDNYKNPMLRISQDIGEHLRIGAFGYYGNEEQFAERNEMWMAGPDLTVRLDRFELNAQYVERRDENPEFVASPGVRVESRGGFGELIYVPDGDQSRFYLAGLYNWLESAGGKYHTITGSVSYLLARNLRLTGEYTYDFEYEANRITLGFVSAF